MKIEAQLQILDLEFSLCDAGISIRKIIFFPLLYAHANIILPPLPPNLVTRQLCLAVIFRQVAQPFFRRKLHLYHTTFQRLCLPLCLSPIPLFLSLYCSICDILLPRTLSVVPVACSSRCPHMAPQETALSKKACYETPLMALTM